MGGFGCPQKFNYEFISLNPLQNGYVDPQPDNISQDAIFNRTSSENYSKMSRIVHFKYPGYCAADAEIWVVLP